VKAGILKVEEHGTQTVRVRSDSTYAERILGFKLKSYNQAVIDMVEHYLELIGNKDVPQA